MGSLFHSIRGLAGSTVSFHWHSSHATRPSSVLRLWATGLKRMETRTSLCSVEEDFVSLRSSDPAPLAETHHFTQSLLLSRLKGPTAVLPAVQSSQRDLAESQRQAGPVLGPRQRGAAAAAQLHRPAGRAPGTQQEVEVGRGVHGVEDVGVVWDHKF